MIEKTDLIIIGAGPGGMQAAVSAAQIGLQVVLIDGNPLPGGQYYKQLPLQFSVNQNSCLLKEAASLFDGIQQPSIRLLTNTLVWGIFYNPKTKLWQATLQGDNCPSRLEAPAIIIATGAYDRSIPFPGWGLPGVITAGAAQVLVKYQGILPGKRAILSGTGPLQYAAAANLVDAGVEVLGVLECNQGLIQKGFLHLTGILGQWSRMKEGFLYAKSLLRARVPYKTGWSVIRVDGEGKVEEVTIAQLDKEGNPIPGTERSNSLDTVVVGYGLTPSTEFFRLLDCEMIYSKPEGVFLPKRDPFFQTSHPGIYAIGDCARIGGAKLAMLEGKVAAAHVAYQSNRTTKDKFDQMTAKIYRAIKRENRFAKMLAEVFVIPRGLFSLAEPETIICRCEQISLAEIRTAISYGAQTVTDIKNITRSGMGYCQGRTCASILSQILASQRNCPPAEGYYLNIRPPIHAVPIEFFTESSNGVQG